MTQSALTDDVWTTVAADESATAESEETSGEGNDQDYPQTKQALCERAEAHAADMAAEHFPELSIGSITWETSTRMQCSAGKAIYNHQSEEITIRLSWDAYRESGWEQFTRVVRHELIHAWQYYERII